VRCHIPDLPSRRYRLKIPLGIGRQTQKIDQLFIHSAQQMSTQNGRETILERLKTESALRLILNFFVDLSTRSFLWLD